MVVEDDIDEDEFEDKWPYSLDKKVEEPEKPMTPSLPSTIPGQYAIAFTASTVSANWG